MDMVKKSITLTEQQNGWIKEQVKQGRYSNDSEVLRDLIRQESERREHLHTLQQLLVAGERSGVSDRSASEILQDALERRRHGTDVSTDSSSSE